MQVSFDARKLTVYIMQSDV